MNSNIVYSTSLKRMIWGGIFPQINPQQIAIHEKKRKSVHTWKLSNEIKKQQQRNKIKRQLAEVKKKAFGKEIDVIMNKIVDEGLAMLTKTKIGKSMNKHDLRIVVEKAENKSTSAKKDNYQKLPVPRHSMSLRKLSQYKLQTDICLKDDKDLLDRAQVQKCIKHYRAGMSPLKKLKVRHIE